MKRGTKVKKINKRNYKDVCDRAKQLESRLRAAIKKGDFPSLHYMREKWGFQLSDAALMRHRKRVMKELKIRKTPKATLKVPRKKRAKKEAVEA